MHVHVEKAAVLPVELADVLDLRLHLLDARGAGELVAAGDDTRLANPGDARVPEAA